MRGLLRLKAETKGSALCQGAGWGLGSRSREVDHALLGTVGHGYAVFFPSGDVAGPLLLLTTSKAVIECP